MSLDGIGCVFRCPESYKLNSTIVYLCHLQNFLVVVVVVVVLVFHSWFSMRSCPNSRQFKVGGVVVGNPFEGLSNRLTMRRFICIECTVIV